MPHHIIYYADDDSMGDTAPSDCDRYRAWAKKQLEAEFPEHEIEVRANPSLVTVITSDIDREEEIRTFASRLWDRCSWDQV